MARKSQSFLINKDSTVKQAMQFMSNIGQKEIFIVDDYNKLFGALSDGDIRKWILKEGSLQERVEEVCNKNPVFVEEDYSAEEVKRLMLSLKIEAIPIVKKTKEVSLILTWNDVFAGTVPKQTAKLTAEVVIMAGGVGKRLDPFTRILPKPLIPINDKPVLEIIMDRFCKYGVEKFYVSVNHKSKMIKYYFEDMNKKYDIHYIEEKKPLGTVGSLKSLLGNQKMNDTLLVTNCDIIIDSDYMDIVKFHNENGNDLTLVVSCKHFVVPYGVCEIENGGLLKSILEKPEYDLLVNTGMYVLEKELLKLIPDNDVFHMTDLMIAAKELGHKIGAFPIHENNWIDVGQWEEYHKAIEKLKGD